MDRPKAKDKVWTQPSEVNNVESLPRGANAKGMSARYPETPRSVSAAATKPVIYTLFLGMI